MTEQLFFHFKADLQTLLEGFFPAFSSPSFWWSHLVGGTLRCAPRYFLCICPLVFSFRNSCDLCLACLPGLCEDQNPSMDTFCFKAVCRGQARRWCLDGRAEGVAQSLASRLTQIQVLLLGAASFLSLGVPPHVWNEDKSTSLAGIVKIKCKVLATLSCKLE